MMGLLKPSRNLSEAGTPHFERLSQTRVGVIPLCRPLVLRQKGEAGNLCQLPIFVPGLLPELPCTPLGIPGWQGSWQ